MASYGDIVKTQRRAIALASLELVSLVIVNDRHVVITRRSWEGGQS